MNVEITHCYDISTKIITNKILNLRYLKEDIENYFENWNEVRKNSILNYITEYVTWNNFEACFNSEEDFENYLEDSSEIAINNLNELVEHFSYLIKNFELSNCCKISLNNNFNYCSTCGTKLKVIN